MNIFKLTTVALAITLTACGGGSESETITPVVAPAPTPIDFVKPPLTDYQQEHIDLFNKQNDAVNVAR